MSSLHLINKSSFRSNSLADCLELLNPEDEILLLEDGVYCGLESNPLLNQNSAVLYAIDVDLSARGIDTDNLHPQVHIVGYQEFVGLSCKHHNSISWS